ncbi:unnamed protein product [Symbiodinium microadriaticum]|nr:unnamed protein product [Symbiodinium microadriaticum]
MTQVQSEPVYIYDCPCHKIASSGDGVDARYHQISAVDITTMTYQTVDGEVHPASMVVDGERIIKRLHHQNKPGVRCGHCGGEGYKWVDDGDDFHSRPVRDACYHCGTEGYISDEQWRQDRLERAASALAADMTEAEIDSANSNPDGEGFAFHAAENGMHEHEYRQACYYENEGRAMAALKLLLDEHRSFLSALTERVAPSVKPKFGACPEKKVSWGKPEEAKTGLAIRWDEPTVSYLVECEEEGDVKFVWVHQESLRSSEFIGFIKTHPDDEPTNEDDTEMTQTKTLPDVGTDKPVFFIDDVDTYYEDSDGDVLFWDSDEMPDATLSMECEYRRIRGVFSKPRGPINADELARAIEAQDGGKVVPMLDAMQAIVHGTRRFEIDCEDSGVTTAPQLLALARQTARDEIKCEDREGFLTEQETILRRERRTSELLMQAIMGMLGHSWVDDELTVHLTVEAATTINGKAVELVNDDTENAGFDER